MVVIMALLLVSGIWGTGWASETDQQKTTAQIPQAAKKTNIMKYDETARGVNAPIYDYYAQQIKTKTGITKGICLDVGCGGGYLGLALAKITDLDFIFLDISPEAIERARVHIIEDGLRKRARTITADVHTIPLPDGSVDLVISRGSIHFWKDPAAALKEIYRVLAPGGRTYVGGGKGTPAIQAQIKAKLKAMGREKEWFDKGPGQRLQRDYDAIMKSAGISDYTIIGDDGFWIVMRK